MQTTRVATLLTTSAAAAAAASFSWRRRHALYAADARAQRSAHAYRRLVARHDSCLVARATSALAASRHAYCTTTRIALTPSSSTTQASINNNSNSTMASSSSARLHDGDSDAHAHNAAAAAAAEAQTTTTLPPPHESVTRSLFASWQQGVVASIGACMGVAALLYFFYAPVKDDTVHHTAVVASEALADLRLRAQALELSRDVVASVLDKDETVALVVRFLQRLLAEDDTRIVVSSLLRALFEDHYTQEVTKKFVLTIVRDAWVQEQIHGVAKEQALRLLRDEQVRRALTQLFITSSATALQQPALQSEAARAVRRSLVQMVNPWAS